MIGVTGVTGAVGSRVARQLAAEEAQFVMLARRPDRAPTLSADVRRCAYGDPGSATASLVGVDTLFMVSATESEDRVQEHRTLIEAAAEAGVEHIVYTSFVGAAPDAMFTLARDHFAAEEDLRSSGITHTILRDNLYLDFLATLPGPDGVIRAPAGEGRVPGVARDDIARAASNILNAPAAYADSVYELTGPEAIGLDAVASLLSQARAERITYHRESLAEAYEYRRRWRAPQWQYDAWVSTYTAIADGQMSSVSGDIERITGVPPLSLAQLLAGPLSNL